MGFRQCGALERRGDAVARHKEVRPPCRLKAHLEEGYAPGRLRGARGSPGRYAPYGPREPVPHGSLSNQIKPWGITPSFALLEPPQTNGVAERFIRALKEQAIYGRTFETIEEVRQAVSKFGEL